MKFWKFSNLEVGDRAVGGRLAAYVEKKWYQIVYLERETPQARATS